MMSRATFFKLHSWLGIVTGAFLLVIAWTGSIAVFKDEIDWLLTPAARADASRPARPLDEVLAAARGQHPDRRIVLHVPYGAHWSYTAYAYGKGPARFLYIDPAAARVTSDQEMTSYTWNAGYFVRQLHVRMLMGLWGRVLVGIFGVLLVLSVITSCWIYRDWLRSLVRLRRDAGRRIFHMDLHKAVGLWALAFNLMFGVTGAVLGLENLYRQVYKERPAPGAAAQGATAPAAAPASAAAASATTPAIAAPAVAASAIAVPPIAAPALPRLPAGVTIGATVAALAAADRAFVPMVVEVTPDVRDGQDARGTIIVRGDHPGALIAHNASAYTLDLATGAALAAEDARRAPWGMYLYNILDPLHFGYFGDQSGAVIGYAVKILWALAGLTPGVLSITGGYMWLLRRQQRQRAAAAAAARRAASIGVAVPDASPIAAPAIAAAARTASPAAAPVIVVASTTSSIARAAGFAAFLLAGYALQASVWGRGWPLSEVLWQHWIVKPLCLAIVCFPITCVALWLGGQAARPAPRPAGRAAILGLLGSVPIGLLYLAATSVLN